MVVVMVLLMVTVLLHWCACANHIPPTHTQELMVHRRLLADDYKGVGEPLNETDGGMGPYPDWVRAGAGIAVRGTHRLLLSTK